MKYCVLFVCLFETIITFVLASLVTKHIPKTAAQAICDNQQKTCPAKPPIMESYKSGICADGSDDLSIYDMLYGRCLDECRARPACTAVNVYSKIKLCRLNFQTGLATRKCPKHVYSEKANWKQKSVMGCETLNCSSIQKCKKVNGQHICVTSECPNKKFEIENGYFFGNQVIFGQTRRFWCKHGYTLIGSKTTRCQTDGTWSDKPPVCSNREEQTMTVSTQPTQASVPSTTNQYKTTEGELGEDKTTKQSGAIEKDDLTTKELTQEVATIEATPPTTPEIPEIISFTTSSETTPITQQTTTSEIKSSPLATSQHITPAEITSISLVTTPESITSEITRSPQTTTHESTTSERTSSPPATTQEITTSDPTSKSLATTQETTTQKTTSKIVRSPKPTTLVMTYGPQTMEGEPLIEDLWKKCGPAWHSFERKCYFFNTIKMLFANAKDSCKEHNSRLVEPLSSNVNDFLKTTLSQLNVPGNWWIGIVLRKDWKFVEAKVKMDYDDWVNGEPDMKTAYKCAIYTYDHGYKWSAQNCERKSYFICEKEATN